MVHITIPNEDATTLFPAHTGTGPFAFTWPYFVKADIAVWVNNVILDISDWTLTPGTPLDGGISGGSIDLVAPVSAADVALIRTVLPGRTDDFSISGVSPGGMNDELDTIHGSLVDHARNFGRAMMAPPGQAPFGMPWGQDVAGKLLMGSSDSSGFDAVPVGDIISYERVFIDPRDYGSLNDPATFQAALDAAGALETGGTVIVPWPKTGRYDLGTTTLMIPDRVCLSGVGLPAGAPALGERAQFTYSGTDAAIINKTGYYGLKTSMGVWIEQIGVEIMTAGATGIRYHRARDSGMTRCVVKHNAPSQIGFHINGSRGVLPGTTTPADRTGIFDCTFSHLISIVSGVTDHSTLHYKIGGTFNDGQVNTCLFNNIRASGQGTGMEMGPGFGNVFNGFDAESFTNSGIDVVQVGTGCAQDNIFIGTYLEPHRDIWDPNGRQPIINEAPLARRNIYSGLKPGSAATYRDVNLATTSKIDYGDHVLLGSTLDGQGLMLPSDEYPKVDIRADGTVRLGDGTTFPSVALYPGGSTNRTNHLAAQSGAITPDLVIGNTISIEMASAVTVNVPTNRHSSPVVNFIFEYTDTVARTVNFSASYNTQSNIFPYLLQAGGKMSVSFFYDEQHSKYNQIGEILVPRGGPTNHAQEILAATGIQIVDLSAGHTISVEMASAVTINSPINRVGDPVVNFIFENTDTVSRTVGFSANWKTSANFPVSIAAGAFLSVAFYYDPRTGDYIQSGAELGVS